MFALQSLTRDQAKALACAGVQNRQHPNTPSVGQGVADEVHTPTLIGLFGCGSGNPGNGTTMALRAFSLQGQPLFDVEPVDAFVIDLPALAAQQDV
jgi:hypothetical protein